MRELPKTHDGYLVKGDKSTAMAVILTIFVAGFGQLYLGRIKEGLIFVGLYLACLFVTIVSTIIICSGFAEMAYAASAGSAMMAGSSSMLIGSVLSMIAGIGSLVLLVLGIVRCCNFAKENNTLWEEFITQE